MARVPVFVPWHVAARDAVGQWLPRSRPARVAVLAAATSVASLVTAALLWLATQTDVLVFATGVAGDRLGALVAQAGDAAIAGVFGEQAFAVLRQSGTAGIVVASLAFVGATAAAVAALRAIAVASSRRRV